MRKYLKGFYCEGRWGGCGRWVNNAREKDEIMALLGKWQNEMIAGDDYLTRKEKAAAQIHLMVRNMRKGEKLTIEYVGTPEIYKAASETN